MHSVYLSHLREIANGSRHAIAINQNLCQKYPKSTGGKGGGAREVMK